MEPHWKAQGRGIGVDGHFLSCVNCAGDASLAATSMERMGGMIADVVAELEEIGLGAGPEKTRWTSAPPRAGQPPRVMGEVSLGPIAWAPTQSHWHRIASWGARQAAEVLRPRGAPWQSIDQRWRFFHKMGHRAIDGHRVDLVQQCRQRVHSWAGHVARLPLGEPAARALRCRGMQWWRWRQAQRAATRDTRSGPRPRRFKIMRLEEQISEVYGEGFSEDVCANAGWLAGALDRAGWKKLGVKN
ncbi:unnamed protein product, partial [Prorocentrum cordatum]